LEFYWFQARAIILNW
jgi:hypothetical protein